MEDRVKKIVDTLIKGTKENKITWEPTEREQEYAVKLDNGGITVDTWVAYDDNTGDPHSLAEIAFLTKKGEIIDRVIYEQNNDFRDYREIINLHDAARRNHFKVDQKLDTLLDEIQRKVGDDDGF